MSSDCVETTFGAADETSREIGYKAQRRSERLAAGAAITAGAVR